jgi:hypothetical protein
MPYAIEADERHATAIQPVDAGYFAAQHFKELDFFLQIADVQAQMSDF